MANTNVTTANKDIDYTQKDFHSVVDAIISFATVNFGPGTSANRLWTSFNADSFSRNWLEIVAFVSDAFFFYFDNQATQTYLQTATVRSAIKNIAKQFGFTPASATSASGVVQFTVTGPGTIDSGFRVQSSNGVEFFLTSAIAVIGAGTVTGTVLQGQQIKETFTAIGLQNEEIVLKGPNVITDLNNINPIFITPQVTVGGNNYSLVDSFIRHTGEDAPAITDSLGNIIGGGGRVFTIDERPSGKPFIKFGDGVFGRKLQPGESIIVDYRTGGGSIGNVPQQSVNTLVDVNSIVSAVTNNADFSGGADEQSIEQLRELIPASLRTLDRAVTEQDYSDILTTNFSEVFTASTEVNISDPGVDLNVYVVPQGSGITKISDNPILKNRLSSFIDRRKMVTIQFQIEDAFEVATLISLEIFISDTASKTTVIKAINTALQNLFNLETGGSDSSGIRFAHPILLKDISDVVEAVEGVERFEIKKLTYSPRIQKNVIGLVTDYNASEVTVYPNVQEREWMLAASGSKDETAGDIIFNNDNSIGFTYNSSTGEITYASPVDLSGVSPGDAFRDGSGTDRSILAVDTVNSVITILAGIVGFNTTAGISAGGSIRNGSTSFESYKVFKKILATATNLSIDTITDNNLDLVQKRGTGATLNGRTLLDNGNVFVPNEFATGQFYLVDAASNIWEILSNDSNTIFTSITAVNDASVAAITPGEYKIVTKLSGKKILFNGSIFGIQYNTDITLVSTGAQFSQIGTIGDSFKISIEQTNIGRLGTDLDLIVHDSATGTLRLNGAPDLSGYSTEDILIDNTGQQFKVVGVDNIPKPTVLYSQTNFNTEYILQDSGAGSQMAQGFKVTDTDLYSVVSFYLKREGNILGNLTARIVADSGGLPDLGNVIAVSEPVVVTNISETGYEKVFFGFITPPTLSASTQYHIVLSSDAGYAASEQSGIVVYTSSSDSFTYAPSTGSTGVVQYTGTPDFSSVQAGHFWQDNSGTLFKIIDVDNNAHNITIENSTTPDDSGTNSAVIINDRILIGLDNTPSYIDGEFSEFDGISQWKNSTVGGFHDKDGVLFSSADAIFSIEGTKSVTIDSDLTPQLGAGATISRRYYDDENEISLVLGISAGSITSATDANAFAIGTVASVPNRSVDNFIFRSSRFADDIVNLRLNEIPQLTESDVSINIFGGIN